MATAEEMIFSFVFFWTLISPRHSAGTLLPISRCFQAVAFAETFINTRPGEGTRRKQAFSRPAGQFPWPQHTLSVLTGTWWWRPTKGARKPRDSLHCFLDLISGHETRTGTGIRRLTEHLFTGTCRGSLRGWQRRKEGQPSPPMTVNCPLSRVAFPGSQGEAEDRCLDGASNYPLMDHPASFPPAPPSPTWLGGGP